MPTPDNVGRGAAATTGVAAAAIVAGGGGGGVAARSGAGAAVAWRIHTMDCAIVSPKPVYAMEEFPGEFAPGTLAATGSSAACNLIFGSSGGENLQPNKVQPPFSAKHSS